MNRITDRGILAARLRPYVAAAALVAGALLLLVTVSSTVSAIRVLTHVYSSPRLGHDTYFVVSHAWTGLFIYGAGVVGVLAFRAMAAGIGRSARLLWRTHFAVTTFLLLIPLAADAGAVMTSDWQMALLLNGTYVLMLLAHSTALIWGGLLLRKWRQ